MLPGCGSRCNHPNFISLLFFPIKSPNFTGFYVIFILFTLAKAEKLYVLGMSNEVLKFWPVPPSGKNFWSVFDPLVVVWSRCDSTLKALKCFFMKTLETKGFFSIWNHYDCLSWLFLIHLNTYVMGLRPLEIFFTFAVRRKTLVVRIWRLQTSDSDD